MLSSPPSYCTLSRILGLPSLCPLATWIIIPLLCTLGGISETELNEDLQGLAAQWKVLGLQLKIPPKRLDEIQEHGTVFTIFERILKEWLMKYGDRCTKQELVRVLRNTSIAENRLAMEIEKDAGIRN